MPKKVYAFLLLIIILFSINVYAFSNGDIDGDNKVSAADYILIRKYLLGYSEITGDKLKRADVNDDGNINSLDYIAIRKILLSGENMKYTVSFDSNGGSAVSSQTIDNGGKAKMPSNPTRKGYTFIEWQLNNKKYDFSSNVSSDLKIVAVWGKIDKTKYELKTNENVKLNYVIEPSNNNNIVTYGSDNNNVAKVDEKGNLTAVGAGNTSINIKVNNVSIGTAEIIVDYSFFDTCSTSKSNTKLTVNSTKNRSINIYSCIENQKFFHQGIAVTNDSIIFTGASYETWCMPGDTYTLKKYNLGGECNSQDDGVVINTSGNYIRKYDKKTGKNIINYLDVGGHGQAFDATSNNELYINYFPKLYLSRTYGYGSHTTGIAYIKQFVNNKEYLSPNSTFLIHNNGNFDIYKSPYKIGTKDYMKDIVSKGKEKDTMYSIEFAIDEDHDQIGVVNKGLTTNGNITVHIYKLSDFKNGKKKSLGTYYIGAKTCYGNSSCFDQGFELYGDYVYSINELHDKNNKHIGEGVSKIKYKTCSRVDRNNSTCDLEEIAIPDNKIGTEYGKGLVGLSEIEGISVIKGKVYVSVITKAFVDDYRRNITLLLDNF